METDLDEKCIKIPRGRDAWMIQLFMKAIFEKDSLRRLSRVGVHHQVFFLSCVLGASGKTLDRNCMREKERERA